LARSSSLVLEDGVRAIVHHLGRIPLERALEMEARARPAVAGGSADPVILVMEHDPVYAVGRAGVKRAFAPGDARRLPSVVVQSTPVVEVDRGGDVTWHGPGQLVVHAVVPIKRLGVSLVGFVRKLEHAAIEALNGLGVTARRREGLTGMWVDDRKLGFIGIACSRWVTYHGMSINVDCDLAAFEPIVPCGIAGCEVTSLARLLPSVPSVDALGADVARRLCARLGLEPVEERAAEGALRG
jgi:lipoyl(octanoyl) transferase